MTLFHNNFRFRFVLAVAACCLVRTDAAGAVEFMSHPPQRALPQARADEAPPANAFVVDAAKGDDANPGSAAKPWRTLEHAVGQVRSGGMICLRGGVYFSHPVIEVRATRERPLVVRAWPGELVVIDGGHSAFQTDPAAAWEPCPDGVPGEYRSVATFSTGKAAGDEDGDGAVLAMGRFLDSLVPLQGYRFHGDLQSDNPWWNVEKKTGAESFVYCGPGVWQDGKTGHIHARLVPTRLPGLGEDNYRGVDDPRRMPLCIATAAAGPVLTLQGARYVKLQDLVLRGSAKATLAILDCADIELTGVTMYGGAQALQIHDTAGVRMLHCACRGLAAPWTYRGALKYRSVESRLLSASPWEPTGMDCREFEIAYCEFTDSVDGVFIGGVTGVRFHHNLVDNVSDDGLFLTARSGRDGQVAGGDIWLMNNRFSRCLTTCAFGVGHGRQLALPDRVQTGPGVWIARNVFDFRRPVLYQWPDGPDNPQQAPAFRGRFGGDHGSPAWEPMWIYHNTMIGGHTDRYDFGISGLTAGSGKGTTRRLLNNLLCVDISVPGYVWPPAGDRFTAEGNLLWTYDAQALGDPEGWRAKFTRSSAAVAAANRLADPRLAHYSPDWREAVDLRPQADSPLVNSGVAVPSDWPDPRRNFDKGAPDVGALPAGVEPWRVGCEGQIDVMGRPADPHVLAIEPFSWTYTDDHPDHGPRNDLPRAIIVRGYPAFDAPIFEYLLRRRRLVVEIHDRESFRLTAKSLAGAGLLVFDGSFARAGIQPDALTAEDVAAVAQFVDDGGTLVLCRERQDLFKGPEGRAFLAERFGETPRVKAQAATIPDAEHPWLKSLANEPEPVWLTARGMSAVSAAKARPIISLGPSLAAFADLRTGRGQIVYLGWSIGGQITDNRRGSAAAADAAILQQVRIVEAMLDEWLKRVSPRP